MSHILRLPALRSAAALALAACALALTACNNSGSGRTGQNGTTSGHDHVMFNANGEPIGQSPDTSKHGNWQK